MRGQSGKWLLIAGRLALVAIWGYAGYAKLAEPWLQFAISIESFKAVPESWLEPMARYLPWCEVALAFALLTGIFARWFGLWSTLVLTLFLSVGIRAKAMGLQVDCGCFGSGATGGIDAKWFAEHGAMVALSLGVTVGYFLKTSATKPQEFETSPALSEPASSTL